MTNIPFNEPCALEPYVKTKNEHFSILQDITLKRAGEICAMCPLRVECQPEMVGDKNKLILRTYED